ncbi:MAG: CTP synthase [bacterium]|nr:CTP synthase [bacterium]
MRPTTDSRFIFVSGGVLSGLGKGITTASLALLLKARGFTVSPIKCDMYVNVDAGTMNPTVHGEVFVTDDGIEADQDLGHYERFLGQEMSRRNYTTTGQVYEAVIRRERELGYHGKCVEVVPHIPEEIIDRILTASEGADFTLVELGGTVGEYQSILFLEATRMLSKRRPGQTVHVHVSYFPFLDSIGELKSKPTQLSIRKLNECGITPDFVVARSSKTVDGPRFNTLCQNSNLRTDEVIFSPDAQSVYQVPLILEKQEFADKILRKFGMTVIPRPHLDNWSSRIDRLLALKEPPLKIGIVSKYHNVGDYTLADSYVSVLDALRHATLNEGRKLEIIWINAEEVEEDPAKAPLVELDGMIVPQGWGSRGAGGKIEAVRYARTKKLPFLGLCYGMQMAVIEFARSLGLEDAHSIEVDPDTKNPVIHIMPDQVSITKEKRFGGTIRLGAQPCALSPGSLLHEIYGTDTISERHRHRYEINNDYRQRLEEGGLVFSGLSPDGKLVEAVELPDHPFFVGVQYHPEYKTAFEKPHPLFVAFLEAAHASRMPRQDGAAAPDPGADVGGSA